MMFWDLVLMIVSAVYRTATGSTAFRRAGPRQWQQGEGQSENGSAAASSRRGGSTAFRRAGPRQRQQGEGQSENGSAAASLLCLSPTRGLLNSSSRSKDRRYCASEVPF